MDDFYRKPRHERLLNNKLETILNLSMRGFTVEQAIDIVKTLADYSEDAKRLLNTLKVYTETGYTIPEGLEYTEFKNTLYSMTDMWGTTAKFLYGEATRTDSYTVDVDKATQYLYGIYKEDIKRFRELVERAKMLKKFSNDKYDFVLYECGRRPGQNQEEIEKMRETLKNREKDSTGIPPVPNIPGVEVI